MPCAPTSSSGASVASAASSTASSRSHPTTPSDAVSGSSSRSGLAPAPFPRRDRHLPLLSLRRGSTVARFTRPAPKGRKPLAPYRNHICLLRDEPPWRLARLADDRAEALSPLLMHTEVYLTAGRLTAPAGSRPASVASAIVQSIGRAGTCCSRAIGSRRGQEGREDSGRCPAWLHLLWDGVRSRRPRDPRSDLRALEHRRRCRRDLDDDGGDAGAWNPGRRHATAGGISGARPICGLRPERDSTKWRQRPGRRTVQQTVCGSRSPNSPSRIVCDVLVPLYLDPSTEWSCVNW